MQFYFFAAFVHGLEEKNIQIYPQRLLISKDTSALFCRSSFDLVPTLLSKLSRVSFCSYWIDATQIEKWWKLVLLNLLIKSSLKEKKNSFLQLFTMLDCHLCSFSGSLLSCVPRPFDWARQLFWAWNVHFISYTKKRI